MPSPESEPRRPVTPSTLMGVTSLAVLGALALTGVGIWRRWLPGVSELSENAFQILGVLLSAGALVCFVTAALLAALGGPWRRMLVVGAAAVLASSIVLDPYSTPWPMPVGLALIACTTALARSLGRGARDAS